MTVHSETNFDCENGFLSTSIDEYIDDLSKDIVALAELDAAFSQLEGPKRVNTINQQILGRFISEPDSDDDEAEEKPAKVNAWWNVSAAEMLKRLLLIISILLTANVLLVKWMEVYSATLTVPASSARPFFRNASKGFVEDCYDGNQLPDRLLRKHDMAVVFYYSSWSTDARAARQPFEVAARMLSNHKRVKLAAINCFSAGMCKQTYKLFTFPVIVAYAGNTHAMYHGEMTADQLYSWLSHLLQPVSVVSTRRQFEDMAAGSDTLVMAYFPFKDMVTPRGYRAFVAAAFAMQEGRNSDVATTFAVVTNNELAHELQFPYQTSIQLRTPTRSVLDFGFERAATAENIVEWVKRSRHDNATLQWWLFDRPESVRSEQLSQILSRSAAFVLISPRQATRQSNTDVDLFRELSREWWRCSGENVWEVDVEKRRQEWNTLIHGDSTACEQVADNVLQKEKCCDRLLGDADLCSSDARFSWLHEQCHGEGCEQGKETRTNVWSERTTLTVYEECSNYANRTADSVASWCCALSKRRRRFAVDQPFWSVHDSRKRELKLVDRCMRNNLAAYSNYAHVETTIDVLPKNESVTGFGCRHSNHSLSFVVLDPNHYPHIIDKWGLDASEKRPRLVAIDVAREVFSVMESDFSRSSIREFARSFVADELSNHKRSEVLREKRKDETKGAVRIEKLNTDTFIQLVEDKNATSDAVILFSLGGWHTASAVVHSTLHATARALAPAHNTLRFYSVDVSRNELPYSFDFDRFPSLVFVQSHRESSWKYADDLPFTQPHITSFILSRCHRDTRLRIAASGCVGVCASRNARLLVAEEERVRRQRRRRRSDEWASRRIRETRRLASLLSQP